MLRSQEAMETRLLESFNLHLDNPSAHLRAIASASALLSNPNSSDATRHAVVNALGRFLSFRGGDSSVLRYAVKLLGDVAALHGTFGPSIVEFLRPLLVGDGDLSANALSALASIDSFVLDEGLLLSLALSPLVSVRSMLVKLLVSSLDGDKRSIVVIRPHLTMRVLLGLSEDLYPMIRANAFDGLASLCMQNNSGVSFQTVERIYDCAALLLRDEDEFIRLSAIRLISSCGNFFEGNKEDKCYGDFMDAIFVQLCTMARDMDMNVRVEAFSAIGKIRAVSENVLLQSLSKKILGTRGIEKTLAESTMRKSKFPFSSSAGAFVHGTEDEFHEVRMSACKSLGTRSILSSKFATSALNLLMDMLNDDAIAIRLQTLETIYQMESNECFIKQEEHMHVFLGLLSDASAMIRYATRKLFLLMKLPKLAMLKSVINSLLKNLETHPEEEEDVFCVLFCIGTSHAKLVLKLASEFTSELSGVGELNLDTPGVAGQLVLIVSSTFSKEQKIAEIPTILFSYAVPLVGRISRSLRGLISQCFLAHYLCQLSGIHYAFGIPKSEDTELTTIKLAEAFGHSVKCRDQICNSLLPLQSKSSKIEFKEEMLKLCRASDFIELFHQEAGYFDNILPESVKFIMKKVQETWPLIQTCCPVVAQRMLSACKEELDTISLDIGGSGDDFVAFALEYVQVIQLVTEIWEQKHAKSYQVTGMVALDILIGMLDSSLRRIRYCFRGFSFEEESHVLELILLSNILGVHNVGICSQDALNKINATLSCLQLLCKESDLSDFIKEVKKFSTMEGTTESSLAFPANELLQLFNLGKTPFCGKFRHIKADLKAFSNDLENPFYFVSGLPFGITFQVLLYNASQMERVWLRMIVGDSIQYIFVDFCQFEGCDDVRKCTLTLPFYSTPRATSFLLKACICLEFLVGDALRTKREQGGPKVDLIQVSEDIDVYIAQVDSTLYAK